jgi:hypothetical protein
VSVERILPSLIANSRESVRLFENVSFTAACGFTLIDVVLQPENYHSNSFLSFYWTRLLLSLIQRLRYENKAKSLPPQGVFHFSLRILSPYYNLSEHVRYKQSSCLSSKSNTDYRSCERVGVGCVLLKLMR